MWNLLGNSKRFFVVGLSESMMKEAPSALKPRILPHVHNAVVLTKFTFHPKKQKYFYTIGRFSPEKGNHIAAQLCDELGYTLKMAGTVAGINTPKQLILELSNPLSDYRGYTDFRYYSDKVWPITVKNPDIQYLGNICAEEKDKLIGSARAFLLPIDWEEPFGMVMIEALACGTPVVAMNRGSVPEIIEHGVNGFVANSVAEFKKYMQRVDEISPIACRESVEKRFSHEVMAKNYLNRYREVLARVK
jgi:glycosyltransferase involved in cell wall biosynthesis